MSNVFRYNKIFIDYVFGNSKFVVPETLTIDRGEAEVNSQGRGDNKAEVNSRGRGDNKLAIPSYPVNKYILLVPKCIIRLIVSASALTKYIGYIYYRNLLFLYNVIIIKTRIIFPKTCVT